MGTEQCTVFAKENCYSGTFDRVRAISTTAVGVVGDAGRWSRLTVRRPKATLTLNGLESRSPGDKLSGILLGVTNYVRNIRTLQKERQKALLKKLLACEFAIGCVAAPDFSSEPSYEECIYEIARMTKGVIFTGSEFLDSEGRVILDSEGGGDAEARV